MDLWQMVLIAAAGYLIGSFPTAYVVGRVKTGTDIRQQGSNNMGAANTVYLLGFFSGLVVAVVDVLKGTAAVMIARLAVPDLPLLAYISGCLAVIGHLYPVFAGFRGGKGAATLVGVAFAMWVPWGLAMIGIFAAAAFLTNYIALASMTMFAFFAFMAFVRGPEPAAGMIAVITVLICTAKHRSNFINIQQGKETRFQEWLKEKRQKKA